MGERIKIGISRCLLGEKVRYDGGHKYDPFLNEILGVHVEFIPVCPEVEAGFPIPREAFRLVGDPDRPRLLTQKTKIDQTERMESWSRRRLAELAGENLAGFVFKANSPSSGMERVKVYNEAGVAVKTGRGIFARMLMERFPLLPVEEEGRLHDLRLRENFIIRIFAYHRWLRFFQGTLGKGELIEFHSRHKYLLMSHHPKLMREMGRLLAHPTGTFDELKTGYVSMFMAVLKTPATVKKHVDVLQHIMGYFKRQLTAAEKKELLEVIDLYHRESFPLIVPITLIAHYQRKYLNVYLGGQYYLDPHPIELKLRNHA